MIKGRAVSRRLMMSATLLSITTDSCSIKKKKIMVGTNRDCPAWLYLGVDMDRMNNEMRQLFRMAQRKGTSSDEVYYLMHEKGLFALVSGSDYPEDEILPSILSETGFLSRSSILPRTIQESCH